MKINITVKVRFWLRWYLYGLVFFCRIMGATPDYTKLDAWLNRGIKVCADTKGARKICK